MIKIFSMTIKELEKEIKEKITVLDKDELKEVIKFIDQLQEVGNYTVYNIEKETKENE
tara:strand:+ start:270 stop:443 length:174 start_codon:yes stop_codon:yes gene_type:complete